MQKPIHVLNQRGDLAQDEERNPRILQQSLNHGQLDTIVRLQHFDQAHSWIEPTSWFLRRCFRRQGNVTVGAFRETFAVLGQALRTIHETPLAQVYRRVLKRNYSNITSEYPKSAYDRARAGIETVSLHPKGTRARVLLTSVFGPYAQDDEFGSRRINPMELYHNQVTRAQGCFSLRMFHRSWGIMMIQENISAPSTLLDFPTREAFAKELTDHHYDIVGISSIIVNIGKVREMCRMVRELSPGSTIVVGGHVAAIPGIEHMIDADHIVRGDGIAWMRRFLGEDVTAPIRHPHIVSGFDLRTMGIKMPAPAGSAAATIIPSVGCPMGCNFCTTSAFFGGKGKFLNFYQTGEELFNVMCEMESSMKVRSFFMMDENFLLYRKRAMELLDRMKANGKAWSLYVFSSANAISKYTMRELVELGISWIWMGLESPRSSYAKLQGHDTLALTKELRQHGIKLLGSTIVGLEHHTPENIEDEIEHAVSHETDFHQFMLYTPVPGTPLYKEMQEKRRLLDVDLADIHGQHKFNFKHAAISRDDSNRFLECGFPARLSSATARACIASAARPCKAGSVTRTIRIRASANASSGKSARSRPLTAACCGPWSGNSDGPTRP